MQGKRRTKKQVAATKRMIAANRKARRSGSSEARKPRPRKRKTVKSSTRSNKRRLAALKAARTRALAAQKAARTRARNHTKRVRAAKKAALTRKNKRTMKASGAHYDADTDTYIAAERRRSKRSARRNPLKRRRSKAAAETTSKRKRKNPIAKRRAASVKRKNPIAKRRAARKNPIVAEAKKHKGRKHHSYRRHGTKKRAYHHVKGYSYKRKGKTVRVHRHMRNPLIHGNPIHNPITGPMEFMGGFLGVGFGFALASLGDRLVTTHALNASNQDAPAVGQIYNSEMIDTPLWANFSTEGWKRLAMAFGAVVLPLGAASAVKTHNGLKTFFQLMGMGALGRTAGKLVDDSIAHLMSTNVTVQRLYAPEVAATTKLTSATTTALPAAAPATFAGLPFQPVVRRIANAPAPLQAPPPPAPVGKPQTAAITQNAAPQYTNPPVPASLSLNLPGVAGLPRDAYGFNPLLCNPDHRE